MFTDHTLSRVAAAQDIDLPDYPNGLHFVRLIRHGKTIPEKLIVE